MKILSITIPKKDYKGAISVYLCLMFAVMVSIILVMIEGARVNAMKLNIECVTDMGTDSLLSEYHKELLSRYGLLFIDTSYEYNEGSIDNTIDHLTSYMEYNLSPDKNLTFSGKVRDFYGLSVSSVEFTDVSRATDNNGQVFRQMAISYMLDKYGISVIADIEDMIETSNHYKLEEGDIINENKKAQKEIDNIEYPEMDDVNWDEVDKSNPSENVRKATSKGILSLVCDDELSSKAVNLSLYASQRSLVSGDGLIEEWPDYSDFTYDTLFNEYIMNRLGCYTKQLEDCALDYQVEYVLFGCNNDIDNLKKTVDRLVLIRGASNTVYYAGDGSLQAQVKAMALALATVTLLPYLAKIYEIALAAALIYAESLHDVSILLKGGKVPLIKGKGDWFFSLENALDNLARSFTDSEPKKDKGQSYEDYLRLMLYLTPNEEKIKHTMDIVEMDIRQITGKENFRLDNCIAAGTAQITFDSSYGYSFLMKRRFCYW